VRLSGWVHRVRDHGGLLFIDLRDHYGITQVVADPDSPAFKAAETVRSEWVIRIDGTVRDRPVIDGKSTVNDELATGEIEVVAGAIEVLSVAKELPVSRCSASRSIPRICVCSTASSTSGARPCTPTS
jgi:aspartyl-tRNA synthetase